MCRALMALFALTSLSTVASAQTTGFTPPGGTGYLGVSTTGYYGAASPLGEAIGKRTYPARPDQVRVGNSVFSSSGPVIGKVAYAKGAYAVVKSDKWALRVPVDAFGVGRQGLLLDVTPSRFDQLAQAGGAATR